MEKFRKGQVIISSSFFIFIFFFFFKTIKANFIDIQLSYWGVNNNFSWLWNGTLILLSISMYINIHQFLKENNKYIYVKPIRFLFLLCMVSLFLTGAINMNYHIHTIISYFYFFLYPTCILLFIHLNYKRLLFIRWKIHLLFSSLMIIVPMISLFEFKGLSIAETSHSIFILLWNLWILRK